MTRSLRPLLHRSLVAGALALLAACSGGGRSGATPTAPPDPLTSSPASITGQIVSVPTGASRGGIRVAVEGLQQQTSTDSAGRFSFPSVEPGSRTLTFASGAISASLAIGNLGAGQSVHLAIALSSGSASIDDSTGADDDGSVDDDGSGDDNGVDDDGSDDDSIDALQLDFNPDQWPLDASIGRGRITARVEGAGFDLIDPATVLLVGPAGSLAPIGSEVEIGEVGFDFDPSAALAILGPVVAGSKVTLTLSFTANGSPGQLTSTIEVVASGSGGSGSGSGDSGDDSGDDSGSSGSGSDDSGG